MDSRDFRIPDHDVEARLARLAGPRAEALEKALDRLSGPGGGGAGEKEGLPHFLLPMAEFGMSLEQMVALVDKVPPGLPLDHRRIYFDFRLRRWCPHLEPPTLAESLEEYMEHAESPAQGLAYLRARWQEFLRRHGAEPGPEGLTGG